MPSLDDLKKRIKSVKSTQKITKAMKMVAAAKLRKAQESAEKGRPYSQKMQNIILNLTNSINNPLNAPKLLIGNGKDKTYLCLVLTADRGLCGGFNSSIAKLARNYAAKLTESGKQIKIITVGKKGRDAIKRDLGQYFVEHVDLSEFKSIKYTNAQSIAKALLARFDDNEYDVATIFYSKFVNVVTQIPTTQQIIPATFDDQSSTSDTTIYDYEPDEETILADLLPRGVATQIFSALLENGASEQGARMSAMDNATRNAGDMIDKLTIEFNRSRQAVITNELIEIISGAEAL